MTTTLITANNDARKSPSRLTTCAYQSRRMTVSRNTSRNVMGAVD